MLTVTRISSIRTLLAVLALAISAFAQGGLERLVVDPPEPGRIRVKDTAVIRISIEDVSANPHSPKLPRVDGLEFQVLPARTTNRIVQDGRRMVQRSSVQFGIEVRPLRTGSFVIPSFTIWTGTKEQRTKEMRLEVRDELVAGELSFLDVKLEPERVYVHEPIRVTCSFAVLQGVRLAQEIAVNRRYQVIWVLADWLENFPAGEAMELQQPTGDVRAVVCNGVLTLAHYNGDYERDGQLWQHYTFSRSYLPSKVGTFELPAPQLRFDAVRRSRRRGSAYGGSGQLEKHSIRGKPVRIEVLPIPQEGRPSPFFGAVGRFQLEAELDRDRVRVADSLKLTLTVRGRGNFEFLRMPELQELKGFHKLGTAEAQRDEDRVVVTYDLTPLSADVTELPPISWNYFDTTPGVEKFVEVATPALPLVIDAIADGEGLAPLPDELAAAVTPGVDDIYDLPDLAAQPTERVMPAPLVRWIAVVLPWLLCAFAFFGLRLRRRAAADVAGQRARGAQRQFDAALRRGDEVLDAFAAYLGDRLHVPAAAVISAELAERLVATGLEESFANEVVATIERGTSARYGGGVALSADDARALVRRLEGERFGARILPLLLWPLLLASSALSCGDLRAQDGVDSAAGTGVPAAVRAYRAGDYAAADAAFARAYEATGDRQLLRARGNCLFRQGDLCRALWAYESARLGLPRDQELLANIKLVRTRLQLPERDVSFVAELQRLIQLLTPVEQLLLCGAGMLLASLCLVFGWRKLPLRWLGFVLLANASVLAVHLLLWLPNRQSEAVALQELGLTAEPRTDLDAVATVREGVIVEIHGRGEGSFVLVDAGKRRGFAPRDTVAIIE